MKRDFLAGLMVGETPLPKDIIDAIMAENGRDIEAAKADADGIREQLKADADGLREQLQAAQDGLKAFEGVDVEKLNGEITKLTGKLEAQSEKHKAEIANLKFGHALSDAITAAHGRNAKAITALLDVQALRKSNDQTADIGKALAALKESDGYLFEEEQQQEQTPPPFSTGTGTAAHENDEDAKTIAAFRAAVGLGD